ncbi:mucin-5AC-like [Eurosta solidaginis]|uniref:mucin-5AC-like n=1 Tax=Eurosta solidaginis TaxID=178769 RepID=UPI0035307E0F
MNKSNKMNYRYNETKTQATTNSRTNGTKPFQKDSDIVKDRTGDAEFPSLRLYKIGTYVHKSFLEYPNTRKTDLIRKNITWAKHIYELGRIMYPNLLTAQFRLNSINYKPDVSNVVRSRRTSSFEFDESLMDDADYMFPDMKDLGIAFGICKRMLKIPKSKRSAADIGRLEWAMEVLDVNDDMVRYLLQLVDRITKEKKEKKMSPQVKELSDSVETVANSTGKSSSSTATETNTTKRPIIITSKTINANSKTTTSTSTANKTTSTATISSGTTTVTKANSTAAQSAGTTSKVKNVETTAATPINAKTTATKANISNPTTIKTSAAVKPNTAAPSSKATTVTNPTTAVNSTNTATKANTRNSTDTTFTLTKAKAVMATNATTTSTDIKTNGTTASSPSTSSTPNKANTVPASSTNTTSTAMTKAYSTNASSNSTQANSTATLNTNTASTTTTANVMPLISVRPFARNSTAFNDNKESSTNTTFTLTTEANNTNTSSTITTASSTSTSSTPAKANTVPASSTNTTSTAMTKAHSTNASSNSIQANSTATLNTNTTSTTTTANVTPLISVRPFARNSTACNDNKSTSTNTTSSTLTTAANNTNTSSTIATANFAATSASIMSNLAKARAAASNAPQTSNSRKRKRKRNQQQQQPQQQQPQQQQQQPQQQQQQQQPQQQQPPQQQPPQQQQPHILPATIYSTKCTIPVLISGDNARIPKNTVAVNMQKPMGNNHLLIGINTNHRSSGLPRPPLIRHPPGVNMPFRAPMPLIRGGPPMLPIRGPPMPIMNNFQQARPMYHPPPINAPYQVQAAVNNFQSPYMYNQQPTAYPPAGYPPPEPHMGSAVPPQYPMQHNYQESYGFNNPATLNMSYPTMQPNIYEPNTMHYTQPVAPQSNIETQHDFYAPFAYNNNSITVDVPTPVPPPATTMPLATLATRTSQDAQSDRDKASRSLSSKTSSTKTSSTKTSSTKISSTKTSSSKTSSNETKQNSPKSTKSFQSRKNIEDFVNPSNPSTDRLSKVLSDSVYENLLYKPILDLTAFSEDASLNAKRRRLIEEGLISDPKESKENIIVGIVDHSAPHGIISAANWSLLQKRLQAMLLELLKDDPGSFPNGLDAGWHQGRIKLFAFENQKSLQLFKRAVYKLGDLWPGARVTVELQSALPHRPRYRAYIPVEPSDPATILKIIRVSNPNLHTRDWEVMKVDGESRNQRCICLVLNAESFEPLLEQGMIITYGFGCIRLKMYKQDKLPHEKEALLLKYNSKKLKDSGHQQVAISRRKSVSERERAEIEREYRNSVDGKRMRADELTSKLAEDILQHLDQIMDESAFNVAERSEYRDRY